MSWFGKEKKEQLVNLKDVRIFTRLHLRLATTGWRTEGTILYCVRDRSAQGKGANNQYKTRSGKSIDASKLGNIETDWIRKRDNDYHRDIIEITAHVLLEGSIAPDQCETLVAEMRRSVDAEINRFESMIQQTRNRYNTNPPQFINPKLGEE